MKSLKNKLIAFNAIFVFLLIIIFISFIFTNEFRTNLNPDQLREINGKFIILISEILASQIIFSIIFSYLIYRKNIKPIKELTKFIKDLNQGLSISRINLKSDKELSDLNYELNNLVDRIEKESKNVERLEKIRSEFLGNVSHELRTPIFSIQGHIETLLNGAVYDNSVNIDFLTKIDKHSERLKNLLNDLIEISRIESKDVKFSFRFFDIQEFIYSVVDEMTQKANAKKIKILYIPTELKSIDIYADKDRIRQVLLNLIDNGIKYNCENGFIEIKLLNEKKHCVISIKDSGIGIPPEDLPRIFERFYRVDKNRSREIGGTGLGLAIVKHIIEAHKGEVIVESTIGEGSTFILRLLKGDL